MRAEEILDRAVRLRPAGTALYCQEQSWSYLELRARVNRLIRSLIKLGIAPGDRVAILHRNCHRFLETYLAALEAGTILVPINPRSAAAEIHFALEDSEAVLAVSEPSTFLKLAPLLKRSLRLRGVVWTGPTPPFRDQRFFDYEELLNEAEESTDRAVDPRDEDETCHLYYTSGSTGTPKGVRLTRGNLTAHVEMVIPELGIGRDTRWGHIAPMYHLADAWAVWAVTAAGGRHAFLPHFEPEAALRLLESGRVTMTNLVPTMYGRMLRQPHLEKRDFSHLELLLSGGAPISPEMVLRVTEAFGCEYAQTYGLTETSPFLTLSRLDRLLGERSPGDQLRLRSTTGRPLKGVEVQVVGEDGSLVPHDDETVGEILARGPTVSPGYWKRPAETQSAFQEGWFHTGDLAVVSAEGYLTIVDRKKDLIIVGGENVYSLEVEKVLSHHPAVEEAAVVGAPDPDLGEVVMALVVLKSGRSATPADLMTHCREHLTAFKVPRGVEFLDELPRTGSGKLSKLELRTRYR